MEYFQDYVAQKLTAGLNGLTLIQINPEIAVDMRSKSETQFWIFEKNQEDDTWQKLRKLSDNEIDTVWDQIGAGDILDASPDNKKKNKLG